MKPSDIINGRVVVDKDKVYYREVQHTNGVLYWRIISIDHSVEPPHFKYSPFPRQELPWNGALYKEWAPLPPF
jgi:hypothetical protein